MVEEGHKSIARPHVGKHYGRNVQILPKNYEAYFLCKKKIGLPVIWEIPNLFRNLIGMNS